MMYTIDTVCLKHAVLLNPSIAFLLPPFNCLVASSFSAFFCHLRLLCFTSFGSSIWAIALYSSLQVILRIPFCAYTHTSPQETDSTILYTEFENELTFPPTFFCSSFLSSSSSDTCIIWWKTTRKETSLFPFLARQTFYYVECKINLSPVFFSLLFCPARQRGPFLIVTVETVGRVYIYVCVLYEKWKSRMVGS